MSTLIGLLKKTSQESIIAKVTTGPPTTTIDEMDLQHTAIVSLKMITGEEIIGSTPIKLETSQIIKINDSFILFKGLKVLRKYSITTGEVSMALAPWLECATDDVQLLDSKDVISVSLSTKYHQEIYQDVILRRDLFLQQPELASIMYGLKDINDSVEDF